MGFYFRHINVVTGSVRGQRKKNELLVAGRKVDSECCVAAPHSEDARAGRETYGGGFNGGVIRQIVGSVPIALEVRIKTNDQCFTRQSDLRESGQNACQFLRRLSHREIGTVHGRAQEYKKIDGQARARQDAPAGLEPSRRQKPEPGENRRRQEQQISRIDKEQENE